MVLLAICGAIDEAVIEGADRAQSTLLPECLDDFIGDDNPFALSMLSLMGSISSNSASTALFRRQRAGPATTLRRC
jgi:hypothetical protein